MTQTKPVSHPVGDAAAGDGMRVRHHVLAPPAGLAGGGGPGRATPAAGRRPDRPEPGLHRQHVAGSQKRGDRTGPNPTDRGRPGTRRHLITDRGGIPLAFVLTGANTHDSMPFEELLDSVPPVGGKMGQPWHRPDKLHADKAYDHHRCRQACRRRGIVPRIARRGAEISQTLGQHR